MGLKGTQQSRYRSLNTGSSVIPLLASSSKGSGVGGDREEALNGEPGDPNSSFSRFLALTSCSFILEVSEAKEDAQHQIHGTEFNTQYSTWGRGQEYWSGLPFPSPMHEREK